MDILELKAAAIKKANQKQAAKMKMSKVGNQTNSQDPQAVNSRVFVGNLNTFQCSKTDVERMFQRYGRLAGISMHKGYAFVQFTNPFDARSACLGEDGRTVLSQILDVNMVAEPKPHQTGRKRQNVAKTGNDWDYYYDSYYASTAFPVGPPRLVPSLKRQRLMATSPRNNKSNQPAKNKEIPPIDQLKIYSNPDILICGNCREMFTDLHELLDHKKTYCKLRFTCKCDNLGKNKSPIDDNSAAALLCVQCKDAFQNAWDLMVHAQAAHMLNIYELGVPTSMENCGSPPISPRDNSTPDKCQNPQWMNHTGDTTCPLPSALSPTCDMSRPCNGRASDSDLSSCSSWSILDEDQPHTKSDGSHSREIIDIMDPFTSDESPSTSKTDISICNPPEAETTIEPVCFPCINKMNCQPESRMRLVPVNNEAKVTEEEMRRSLEILLAAHKYRPTKTSSALKTSIILFITIIAIIGISMSFVFIPRLIGMPPALRNTKTAMRGEFFGPKYQVAATPPPLPWDGRHAIGLSNEQSSLYDYKKAMTSYYNPKFRIDEEKTKETSVNPKVTSEPSKIKITESQFNLPTSPPPLPTTEKVSSRAISSVLIGPKLKEEERDVCPRIIYSGRDQCTICDWLNEIDTKPLNSASLNPPTSTPPTSLSSNSSPPPSPTPTSLPPNSPSPTSSPPSPKPMETKAKDAPTKSVSEVDKAKGRKATEQNILRGLRRWGGKVKRELQSWLPAVNRRTIKKICSSSMNKMNLFLVLHIVNDILLIKAITKLRKDLREQVDCVKTSVFSKKHKCDKSDPKKVKPEIIVNLSKTHKRYKSGQDHVSKTKLAKVKTVEGLVQENKTFDYITFLQELQRLKARRIELVKKLDPLAQECCLQEEKAGRARDNHNIRKSYEAQCKNLIDQQQLIHCLSYLYSRKRDVLFLLKKRSISPEVFHEKCCRVMKKLRKMEKGIVDYYTSGRKATKDGQIPQITDLLVAKRAKRMLKKITNKPMQNNSCIEEPVEMVRISPSDADKSEVIKVMDLERSKSIANQSEKLKTNNLSVRNFSAISYFSEPSMKPPSLCRKTKVERDNLLKTWKERYEQLKSFWKSRQEYYDKRVEVCQLIKAIIPENSEKDLCKQCSSEKVKQLTSLAANALTSSSKPAPQETSTTLNDMQNVQDVLMAPQQKNEPVCTSLIVRPEAQEQYPAQEILDDLIQNVVQQQNVPLPKCTALSKSVQSVDYYPEKVLTEDDTAEIFAGSDSMEEDISIANASNELIENVFNDIKMIFKEETAKVQQHGARLKKKLYDQLFEKKMQQLQNSVGTVRELLGGNVSENHGLNAPTDSDSLW